MELLHVAVDDAANVGINEQAPGRNALHGPGSHQYPKTNDCSHMLDTQTQS